MPKVVETSALELAESLTIEDRVIERGCGFDLFGKDRYGYRDIGAPTFLIEPMLVDSHLDDERDFMRPHEALKLFTFPPPLLIYGDENQSFEEQMVELFSARQDGVKVSWFRQIYLESSGEIDPDYLPFTRGGRVSVPRFSIATFYKEMEPSTWFYLSPGGRREYWEGRAERLENLLGKLGSLDPDDFLAEVTPDNEHDRLEASCLIGAEFIDFSTSLRGVEKLASQLGLEGCIFYENFLLGFDPGASVETVETVDSVAAVLKKYDASWRWWRPEKNCYSGEEAFSLRRDISRFPFDPSEAKVPICTIEIAGRPFYVFRDFAGGGKLKLVFRPLQRFKVSEEAFGEIADLVGCEIFHANLQR